MDVGLAFMQDVVSIPLSSTTTSGDQSHCTSTPRSRIPVCARTTGFPQSGDKKVHTGCVQTLIGSCHLSGPGGYWPNPMSLEFKENQLFNPVYSNWNLQNFRDPTEMPQQWLQRPGRGTNKMGCRHQTPLTQSSVSLICFACLPLPYDFISRNEIKFRFFCLSTSLFKLRHVNNYNQLEWWHFSSFF